ncbi:MAG: acetyl-CoA carboxylase biotin carboxylase subunit [Deltaproteobacteria bacterium]|nr:acetyl-CoA carboxylase biotin carboxylase subunit [Deltaproteobacteria bacterium]MBW1929344.1 acetyl-CoA carboxylase biotin carboxylase subunit [Deltaproteobacteria bacterium]MBW2025158.1 acetyl-CoA carboxylase biotin carboxylase subunit [Deltaproteobacteria bacterium]MBW2125984.1 acetyl-CoA carboxylase biotin carboxylase subunit [Deltaproteobacteria bacterium]RLB20155.1 MAG: acetyl-CoA carboxylase biotin carboxylase subunit [Deltaproteobacteria bacterium]
MFKKILVANRGEIAVRIMRTCKEMGIETVAVYSESDELALHVLESDQAVAIGPAEPSESYLNIPKIIEAAKETKAEAIHPGYGFLAENPAFAKACEQAGIVFIGPPAKVIEDLGNKTVARQMMQEAGVPVIPGMLEATTDMERIRREADQIGYPILIKAASGGGGKGMRVVQDPAQMEDVCMSAISEAEKAFGDGSIYLEKFLDRPRHVEFQILADSHGNVVHLFERECSIQRRHQKIIEETPSPALTPWLCDEMGEAAVTAAKVSGYVNAGTVEFMLEPSGRFYFLEVNTRLQVEHPITELTTGLDLVRHQLEIASGNPLSFGQDAVMHRGHAIECRIYAEDPAADFFPCPGKITGYQEPTGPGIRIDSGVYNGYEVPMEYDPILSKLIVVAETRELARQKMIRALENYQITGITTTIPFLLEVIKSLPYTKADTSIDFVERYFSKWQPNKDYLDVAAVAYLIAELESSKWPQDTQQKGLPTPWQSLGAWTL